jgi:hypothetical protein
VLQVSNYLRRRLADLPFVAVVNPEESGPSTVFRVYPRGVNGKLELSRELSDPGWKPQMERNNQFMNDLFQQREKHLQVTDPKLDVTQGGTWTRYDRDLSLPGWKAYLLNPRVSISDVDQFISNLCRLHGEFQGPVVSSL